ncbi:Eukaryotic translation initiation factor 4E type 2 like protein [Verticillium longisporum]|nr:Eukaryotic translation initiation factor 4E type 2 like protein [Verticillium longisporum]
MVHCKSIEEFVVGFRHLKHPSELPVGWEYHFFKRGIRPIWEDEINRSGGKWVLRLKKGIADRYWEDTRFALLGEAFQDVGEEICGGVVSIRNGEDVISIWTRSTGGRVLKIRASAFLDINAGDSVIGFADANDTGIPALRDWLTPCAARSDKGDEVPTQRACESALHAQEQWENKRPSVHVSHPERNEKVSYMTYKACVRRGGHEWTTSAKPRMTYNWMSSVFWQEAFFQRLPKIINDAESRNTRIFNDFITDLVTDDEIPAGFCDLLRRRVPSLQTQRDVFLQEVRSIGNDFRNDALRLKPHVSDIFTKHMAPVFAKAFSITGVGAFVEQKKVVKEQFESKLPEMLQEARNFIEEELVSSKTQRVNKLRGSISTHNGKPGIRLIELDKIFKNLLRDARAPASKIAGRSQGTQSEAVTAAKETIRAALGEWHGYWQPIEQALPKRPTTMVSDDSENEEEEEELEAPGKKKTAGGKAKPKAKPKANKAPPKPKAAPRPRASSKANVDALPQPKIVKAKAQPRSMSVVKMEEDDEMHTGGTMADDAPHTGGSPANRQQIGAMMAAVTAETESLSGHRQDNSAK